MPYFTIFKTYLLCPYDLPVKERDKLDEFLTILELSNIGPLIEKVTFVKQNRGGRPSYNPYRLFATILYGFSKHSGSLRKIQESMSFDLRFLYLMDGEIPSHVTIGEFLNNVVVPLQKELFTMITQAIIKHYQIDINDTFVDGTKLEANANKYKFVWKPNTFLNKLNLKIRTLLSVYFPLAPAKNGFTPKEIAQYLSLLHHEIEIKNLSLTTGKGQKTLPLVRDYHCLNTYLLRLLDYQEKIQICGPDRNSYFKTDHDATAMTLKVDYYSGLASTMRAAYNLQIIVAKGFVLHYFVSQDRNDFAPFIPLLTQFIHYYGHPPTNLCADAGYGSTANYAFLATHNITNFIKDQGWQTFREARTIPLYTINDDLFLTCLNSKTVPPLTSFNNSHPKSQFHRFYHIPNCVYCRYKNICFSTVKNQKAKFRTFHINPFLEQYKTQARHNLLSPKGIEMRINRSSQVEGVYGIIKQNMDYTRLRRRGLPAVGTEIMLVCLGYNIRKLFTLINGTAKMDYWVAPSNLQPEQYPVFNLSKLTKMKKQSKGLNHQTRSGYKYTTKKRAIKNL